MSVSGSSLVGLITSNRVIIAADSIQTAVTDGVSSFDKICKIRREGNRFYGAVGDYGVPGTVADVWAIARNGVCRATTAEDVYNIVEPAVFAVLPDIVERNRIADPKTYAQWLSGESVISLIFAWFEKGGPIVISIEFRIDAKGMPTHIKPTILGPPSSGQLLNTARLGYHAEIDTTINSAIWQHSFLANRIGASRDLIQREIDASEREKRYDVGLPISILTITANAAERAKGYEGACSDK